MRRRILLAMTLVAALALVLSYLGVIAFFYQQNRTIFHDTLRDKSELLALGLNGQDPHHRLAVLRDYQHVNPRTRTTLIGVDGRVLFDSEFDPSHMENHNNRPEVRRARADQHGASTRESVTLNQDMSYYAKALSDGTVIRVAKTEDTVYATLLAGLPVLIGIALVVFGLALLVAKQQAQVLIAPLHTIDLNHPLQSDHPTYPELLPLLERLEEKNHDKELAVKTRREFSANVSHELKTPLTSISGYAEIIRNGLVLPEDIPGFANRIQQEATRLLTLISDIMDLSRLDEGFLPDDATDVDIFEICKDVVSRLQPRAMELFVALSLSGTHASARGVALLLNEMVFNLVENAVKYNHEGGYVKVWVGLVDGCTQLRVADDGIGIPVADQERIFERFYRVDKSHSKETGGTGLGLSIVKHTAMLHQAEITVESEVGSGTRIEVTFPVASSRGGAPGTTRSFTPDSPEAFGSAQSSEFSYADSLDSSAAQSSPITTEPEDSFDDDDDEW